MPDTAAAIETRISDAALRWRAVYAALDATRPRPAGGRDARALAALGAALSAPGSEAQPREPEAMARALIACAGELRAAPRYRPSSAITLATAAGLVSSDCGVREYMAVREALGSRFGQRAVAASVILAVSLGPRPDTSALRNRLDRVQALGPVLRPPWFSNAGPIWPTTTALMAIDGLTQAEALDRVEAATTALQGAHGRVGAYTLAGRTDAPEPIAACYQRLRADRNASKDVRRLPRLTLLRLCVDAQGDEAALTTAVSAAKAVLKSEPAPISGLARPHVTGLLASVGLITGGDGPAGAIAAMAAVVAAQAALIAATTAATASAAASS